MQAYSHLSVLIIDTYCVVPYLGMYGSLWCLHSGQGCMPSVVAAVLLSPPGVGAILEELMVHGCFACSGYL